MSVSTSSNGTHISADYSTNSRSFAGNGRNYSPYYLNASTSRYYAPNYGQSTSTSSSTYSIDRRNSLPNAGKQQRSSVQARISAYDRAAEASILQSSVKFVASKRAFESDTSELKRKYLCLSKNSFSTLISSNVKESNGCVESPPRKPVISNGLNANGGIHNVEAATSSCVAPIAADLPAPQFDIFPANNIRLQWDPAFLRPTGVGLNNLGNTCFLNSVLQVLTNTAPLVNYLLGDKCSEHTGTCLGTCALCMIKSHVQRVFTCARNGQDTLSPTAIATRVRCFMKSHSMGRQEDAHEYLRYFIDDMQSAALLKYKDHKLDLYTKETSVISRIFGGYHKNEIICNNCHSSSVTYDPFLDLSVEVKQSTSLEAALTHFTCAETLASDNAYLCPKCKRRVSARKMFTIYQPPNILTVQLKRFDHFGKIDRFINYPERINLRAYMSEKQGSPVNYKLYGVIVHLGRTTHSGHYFAFVRNPCDQWHLMDDSRVSAVPASNALRHSSAYLLFYIYQPTPVVSVRPQSTAATATAFIGPLRPLSVSAPSAPMETTVSAKAEPQIRNNAHPRFKQTFSPSSASLRPLLAFSSLRKAGGGDVYALNGDQNLMNGPVVSNDKQLPGVRVHPIKLRLAGVILKRDTPKIADVQHQQDQQKPKEAEEETPPSASSSNSMDTLLENSASTSAIAGCCSNMSQGEAPKPIQDCSISSSTTKLVPYDDDDDDEDEEEQEQQKEREKTVKGKEEEKIIGK